jgi:SAM-dependent methyltransferase
MNTRVNGERDGDDPLRATYEDNLTDGIGERIRPAAVSSGGYRDHLARYLFAGHFVPGRAVVDLCCGNGYGSNLLLAAGATRVTGIDLEPAAVSAARSHYPGPEFQVGSADVARDLSDYGVAVCFEGIEHVADPDQLLANMRGAGLALVSSPNADFFDGGFSGNPHHRREWTRAEFEAVLSGHFSEVRMYFQWHYPDPLDIDRRPATLAKALVPVSLKRRLRGRHGPGAGAGGSGAGRGTGAGGGGGSGESSLGLGELPQAGDDRANYRVHRATALALSRVLPGLRYGEPADWIAVCRP